MRHSKSGQAGGKQLASCQCLSGTGRACLSERKQLWQGFPEKQTSALLKDSAPKNNCVTRRSGSQNTPCQLCRMCSFLSSESLMHCGGTVMETRMSAPAEEKLGSFSPQTDTSVSVPLLVSSLVRGGRGGQINSSNTADKCQSTPSGGSDDLPTVAPLPHRKHPETEDRT